jgi:DNA-binding response OmpR family regulator
MLRILLAECNQFDAPVVKQYLQKIAIVDHYSTLTSALAVARVESFDAVILDLTFPDCNSEKVVSAFVNSVHPMPLLVCSDNIDNAGKYIEWIDAALQKPFTKSALVDAVLGITNRVSHKYLKQSTQRILESLSMLKIANG